MVLLTGCEKTFYIFRGCTHAWNNFWSPKEKIYKNKFEATEKQESRERKVFFSYFIARLLLATQLRNGLNYTDRVYNHVASQLDKIRLCVVVTCVWAGLTHIHSFYDLAGEVCVGRRRSFPQDLEAFLFCRDVTLRRESKT
jgi:hypothetical protein